MSLGTAGLGARVVPHPYRLTRPFRDSLSAGSRNLIAYWRVPSLLVFSTIQPIIFVLMFRYVFGGVVGLAGLIPYPYVDYLMPGIFVQTTVFGAIGTSIGLATDLQSGLLERFRSLPMSRSAVLAGRTLADLVRNVFVAALMVGMGFAVGFRIRAGVPGLIAAMLLVLFFGYALVVGFRLGRPHDRRPRDGPGRRLPGHGPARLRLFSLRPGDRHARLAPSLRRPPAGLGHRDRRPGALRRRADGDERARGHRLEHRHPRRLRPARGAPLPAGGLRGPVQRRMSAGADDDLADYQGP